MNHSFTIYQAPKACQRHRTTKTGHKYPHPGSREYQYDIKFYAQKYIDKPFLEGVELHVKFWFPRPGKLLKTRPNPPYLRVGKSDDLDNLLKNIMDGLTGIGYIDDGQVVKVSAEKWVCGEADLRPRVEIEITDELWGELTCPICGNGHDSIDTMNNHIICRYCDSVLTVKQRTYTQWKVEAVE